MNIDFSGLIFNAFFHGAFSILKILAPILLWVLIPGVVTQIIFKSRQAYSIGAFVGLLGLFTIGPFGNYIQ
jgi:hypothetical protein